MPRENVVFVTGVGGPAGKVASTWFTARGLEVVGADMSPQGWVDRAFTLLPPAADPGFTVALLAAVRASEASLLVPTVSDELPFVARAAREVLTMGCALAMGPSRGVDVAHDKLLTAGTLAAHGVPVPRTFEGGAAREVLVEELGLPLLAKPRVGRGGRGVKVLRTVEEVLAVPGNGLIWQEFAPGEEYDVNLFVERDGTVAASQVLRKTALREGLTGNAAGVERVEAPDVREVAERAVTALGLAGPLDVDVRRGRAGEPLVLEINARLGANALTAPEVLEALYAAWKGSRCDLSA